MLRTCLDALVPALLVPALLAGCQKPAPPPVANVVLLAADSVPEDPLDAAWQAAPEYVAPMIPQDLVEPRQMAPTTPEVRIRAIHTDTDVSFRLEWDDATPNDVADQGRFCDACAVQVPQTISPNVPAPQMGETAKGVEIAYWTAGWQAVVDGRGDSIRDIYPDAAVDHYPFDAPTLAKDPAAQQAMALRYAPARALGNRSGGPRDRPVQDLLAEGPGTITPAPRTTSRGHGRRTEGGWAVVISRRLPGGFLASPNAQVAFAVWDGDRREVGSRKMRTAWIPVTLQQQP